MPGLVDNRAQIDKTVKIFDEFYSFKLNVSESDYDIVKSYFFSLNEDEQIAENFTVFLFRISAELEIPVINLLSDLQGNTGLQVNQIMAYYMNSFKSKSSLYGVSQVPPPNPSVARNILQ
jgi:hypothetical protein